MPESEPTRIIKTTAGDYLSRMGYQRLKGSRAYIEDRGWMFLVISFESSGFSKGTYLQVGAHFLWSDDEHWSFDVCERVGGFHPFESEMQFRGTVLRIAKQGTDKAAKLKARLKDVGSITRHFRFQRSGWAAYHKAVAFGLLGSSTRSNRYFARVINEAHSTSPDWVAKRANLCKSLQDNLLCAAIFRVQVTQLINSHRQQIGLAVRDDPFETAAQPRAAADAGQKRRRG